MIEILRHRRTAVAAVALAAASSLTACGGGDDNAGSADKPIVIAGTPLSTADILTNMSLENKLPEKGVDISYEQVRTVSVLYQDFTAGRYDCIFTDPGVFVEQASQGLPVTNLAAVSPHFAYLIAPKDSGITSPEDLVGKRIVAATATGGYKVFSAMGSKWYDVDFDKQVEVVQATSDVDGLGQITTGKADAMFTFETSVTKSVMSDETVGVAYSPGTDYKKRTGETLWENVLMCRTDHQLDAEKMDKVVDVLAETGKTIMDDPKAADSFAVGKLKAEKGVYEKAFSSKRLEFEIAPINEENKQEMINMIKFQQDAGTMNKFDIPDSYFAGL